MRTLVLLACAAFGLSPAFAEGAVLERAASLDGGCKPGVVPGGAESLLSCTFVVENEGDGALRGVQFSFAPSAVRPIPEFYWFTGAAVDGRAVATEPQGTVFQLGDLEPDERRALQIEAIVRSGESFGTEGVVSARPDYVALDTVPIVVDTGPAGEQPIGFAFEARSFEPEGDPFTSPDVLQVMIINESGRALHNATVEVAYGSQASFAPLAGEDWRIEPLRPAVAAIGEWQPLEGRGFALRFRAGGGECALVRPALVVRHAAGAAAAVSPITYAAGGACQVADLPAAGLGPPQREGRQHLAVVAVAVAGLLSLLAGIRSALAGARTASLG